MELPLARLIAFYLPQFHPIPENDEWWGPGFTEWTNVARAKPLFPSHCQPRLPADLGFYDLRVPEVREAQAELARNSGIEAFCYWHYWFGNGRRILERPFEEVRDSGRPDFPFCLAWANESWTGVWHGNPKKTLIEQTYPGKADEVAHFRWAQKAFEDNRYATVDGKQIFVVFSPPDLPSTEAFVEHWRELAVRAGYKGIYFVGVAYSYSPDLSADPVLAPFDAVTLLGPVDYTSNIGRYKRANLVRIIRKLRELSGLDRRWKELSIGRLNRYKPRHWQRPMRVDYADVVADVLTNHPEGCRYLPSVMPGWDNTPRSGVRGIVYEGETPELFAAYLQKAISKVAQCDPQHRIIFIKAWNEWAEGNYLEPDSVHGHAFLDAARSVICPKTVSVVP